MNKKIISIIILTLACMTSCAKKDRLTTSTLEISIEPGAASMDAGAQQQFIAYGASPRSADIEVSPFWQVNPVSLGSFSAAQGKTTIFTAAGSGLGSITATISDVSTTIEIAVKAANDTIPADVYGIYSETDRLKLTIATDSYIGVFESNPAYFDNDAFADITNDVQEGVYAKKTTVTVPATSAYAGWYIQYGLEGDNDTLNMEHYQNGNLKFWIKTPVDLEVGIGDLTKDAKLFLSSISGFSANNKWQEVSIPINNFPAAASRSSIKKFFIIAATSDVGGTAGVEETFYIDHVRWTRN